MGMLPRKPFRTISIMLDSTKTDWVTILAAIQVGYCGNAVMWRLDRGKTDDIIYPVIIALATLAVLVLHTVKRRNQT